MSLRAARWNFCALLCFAASTWGAVSEALPDEAASREVVEEAGRSDERPERLRPLLPAQAYDRVAYRRDPAAYCSVVEPERVFQSAMPNEEVLQLTPATPTGIEIARLGSTPLAVITAPGAPATFITEGGGVFANGLGSITVQADETGLASTVYTATAGAFGAANILVGSPEASGQVQFAINIGEQ